MSGVEYSLSSSELIALVESQLRALGPAKEDECLALEKILPPTLERLEHCWRHVKNKYFYDGRAVHFDHLHSDQWTMFLYLLANTGFRHPISNQLCSRLYALNKLLGGIDLYFEVELPNIFYFQHPIGSVVGRAKFSDYLVIYQRVSIGSNLEGEYPTFGEGVALFGNAVAIGDCKVGNNVMFSVNSQLMDADVPDNSLVFGTTRRPTIKPSSRTVKEFAFRD